MASHRRWIALLGIPVLSELEFKRSRELTSLVVIATCAFMAHQQHVTSFFYVALLHIFNDDASA